MSTKPTAESPVASSDKQRFSKQIDAAFETASKLAGGSLAPAEFYEQFLNTALGAVDAPAGVIWLRTPQGFLQIACQKDLDKVGLDAKRGGRQCHNEILRQVFQSAPARPVMMAPQERLQGVQAEPGGVPAANLTDYYALFAPIVAQDKTPMGLLEVFHEANHDPRLYQTFLQYAVQMAGYASQYHQFSNARQSAGLEKVFGQIEAFARQIHSSLNPTEVAYHVANEGRRLVEADRLCVGVRHGKKCTVEAVSGADVVEKASTHVRRMRALFDAVLKFGDKLVYKGEKDEGLPPDLGRALDDYLAESQPKLLVVTPIRDDREKDNGKPARSVLLMECFNPPEQVEPLVQKLDVVSKHAANALYNAAEMRRVPFGFIWRPVSAFQESIGGKHRLYWLLGTGAAVALVAAMVLVPYPLKMSATGEFLPEQVKQGFAPYEGEVRQIHVKPGDAVRPGAPLFSLFSATLQQKMAQMESERHQALLKVQEYETFRARGGIPAEQEARYVQEITSGRATAEGRGRLLADMQRSYGAIPGNPGHFVARAPDFDPALRAPSGLWKIISNDNREQLNHKTVKQNEPLLRLGVTDGGWRGDLKIPQRAIGHIKKALVTPGKHVVDETSRAYLPVDVLFASDASKSFVGRLYLDELAAQAEANRDDHNQNEPVVTGYVRVPKLDDLTDAQKSALFVAGQEVHVRIRCGDHALGYSLFHGVWEWFYEKVIFFF